MTPTKTWPERFRWLGIRRREVAAVVFLALGSVLAEGGGVGFFLPILEFADHAHDTASPLPDSRHWQLIANAYAGLGLPLTMVTLMIPVFILFLLRQIFIYCKEIYSANLMYRIMRQIQLRCFETFVRADLSFVSTTGIGRLMNAITTDGQRASAAVQFHFDLIAVIARCACYATLLVAVSGWSALIGIAIVGVIALLVQRFIRQSYTYGEAISNLYATLQRRLVELLGGLRLVKLSDREDDAIRRVGSVLDELKVKSVEITKMASGLRMLAEPIAMLLLLGVLFFAVELVNLSLARISILAVIVTRLVPLARAVLDTRQALNSFLPSIENVERLIETGTRARTIHDGSEAFPGPREEIQFNDVSFRYPGTPEDALQGVSLNLPANQMIALVGHSGAGKSTLVDMIPRLIVPSSGRITIDGRTLESFTLSSLRQQVAFVPQEGIVFDDTVTENIRYSRKEASDEEVMAAARMARAHEFIERLENGYATVLGERGIRLSMGQRQRISLARALLQGASILVLDEPTSALDLETERGIQESLELLRKQGGTTLIVIAHRLSTIYRADLIVVLDHGRVLEQGTHAQLKHNDEWYSRVQQLQMLPDFMEPDPTHA